MPGAIHGSNLGFGNGGAGGNYSGERMLNGATWSAVTRGTTSTGTTCFTKGTSSDAVSGCGQKHVGQTSSVTAT